MYWVIWNRIRHLEEIIAGLIGDSSSSGKVVINLNDYGVSTLGTDEQTAAITEQQAEQLKAAFASGDMAFSETLDDQGAKIRFEKIINIDMPAHGMCAAYFLSLDSSELDGGSVRMLTRVYYFMLMSSGGSNTVMLKRNTIAEYIAS